MKHLCGFECTNVKFMEEVAKFQKIKRILEKFTDFPEEYLKNIFYRGVRYQKLPLVPQS